MRSLIELYSANQKKQNNKKQKVLEDFVKYYIASIVTGDVDPEYPLINYLKKKLNFNQEELLWYCWLYGATYHEASTHWIWLNLPEPMPSIEKFTSWHERHKKQIEFGRDLRGSRLKLHLKYRDYKRHVDKYGSQAEFFKGKSYMELWNIFRNEMFLFGRYSTFFYLETLKRCAKLPISAPSMFLEEAWSPRKAICYIFGLDFNTTPPEVAAIKGDEILNLLKIRCAEAKVNRINSKHEIITNDGVDYEYLETVLCAFRGAIFEGSRYVGYYIDRMQGGILKMEQKTRTKLTDLWEARQELFPHGHLGELHNWNNIRKPLLAVYAKTGKIVDLEPTRQLGFLE